MITGKRYENLAARVTSRTHELISGVEPNIGGGDEGLNPHRILEAALAACTIITVQMYANRKKMKLESTHAEVNIASEGAETKITRVLDFKGELTDAEKEQLLTIANKCPIHKLLIGKIEISTELKSF